MYCPHFWILLTFTSDWLFTSVCRDHSTEQKAISPGGHINGWHCGRSVCSLSPHWSLWFNPHLSCWSVSTFMHGYIQTDYTPTCSHFFPLRSEDPKREQVWQSDAWCGAQPLHSRYSTYSLHSWGDGGDAEALLARALQSPSTG